MGLHPLEFSDCLTDSPYFRENLHAHEKELERTSKAIKNLINECKDLMNAAKTLSKAQRNFSNTLMNFKFDTMGSNQTDDEVVIAGSLKEFGRQISAIEDERDRMLDGAYSMFIHPLENFRKEQIGGAKEGKKKFDKQTSKFCQSLERYLNLKAKTNDNQLQEADAALEMERRHFHEASMQYVLLLQKVQERKKFEFVETLLGFMYSWLTFYHQGYDVSKDFKPYMTDLQCRLQKTRDAFSTANEEAQSLMNKMLEVRGTKPTEHTPAKSITREGYLYLLEKKTLGTTSWSKYYCQYQKQNKILTMIPYNQVTGKGLSYSKLKNGGALTLASSSVFGMNVAVPINTETMVLTSCTRRASETIDKRFCFDITVQDRTVSLTLQALSEEDRRIWLDAMDGKEPIYNVPANTSELDSRLDDIGFNFIKKCIAAIENKGLVEQGLYRVGGVNSKINRLTVLGLDRRKADKVVLEEPEWEIKTITSALKSYFRNLPEPLMTFELHEDLIQAAKQEAKTLRVHDVHTLVHRLPDPNFEMLHVLIKHLANVAAKSDVNLMTVSNIGVCFGPTLMRPREETMAAIMDIKFFNIIVEILVENCDKIFTTPPDGVDISQVKVTPPLAKPPHPEVVPNNMVTNTEYVSSDAVPSPSPSPTSKTSEPPTYTNVSNAPTYAQYRARLRHVGGIYSQYSPSGADHREHHSSNSSSSDSISSKSSATNQASSYVANIVHNAEKRQAPPTPTFTANASSASPQVNAAMQYNQTTPTASARPENSSSAGSVTSLTSVVSSQPSQQTVSSHRKVRTLYACEAENDTELSFEPNQIIINVKASREPGWLEGSLHGKSGLIPANYVEYIN